MSEDLLSRYGHAAADGRQSLTSGELLELIRQYPWWPAPAIDLLRLPDSDIDAGTREKLRNLIALNCTDMTARAALTSDRGALMARFYPPEESGAATDTDDAIATFLETYGHSSPEEDRLLEQMIFNPVPDYGAVLAVDDDDPDVHSGDEASSIDAFVKAFAAPAAESAADETPAPATPAPRHTPAPAQPSPASSLSESLAKIYIKQGRYNKAYEIILHLYLNNPKKSIYFADQLRFLRKLMLNSDISDKATN
ncbi:MAG: hypothetical protein K2L14_02490 [Duncaniella sp.]|nr:hypothetical protein [Duncaniella sp.]